MSRVCKGESDVSWVSNTLVSDKRHPFEAIQTDLAVKNILEESRRKVFQNCQSCTSQRDKELNSVGQSSHLSSAGNTNVSSD